MTKILSLILAFISLTAQGQKTSAKINFKQTNFDSNGKILSVKLKSIQVSTKMDLEFYRTNFYRPNHFPQQFVDKKFKSQTIVYWSDTTKTKDFTSNWNFTYSYDSLSRVTEYIYSGCIICSQLPYRIKIKYDQLNRPIAFEIRHALNIKNPPDEEYKLTYDLRANIVQIKFFRWNKIDEQIDRI